MAQSEQSVWEFFEATAAHYEADIVPAFRLFAQAVVDTAQPRGSELTLDVGTGTGILARLIGPRVRAVVGIDAVPALVREGAKVADISTLIVGDAHVMPFQREAFDLVVASFGLNGTDPSRSLPAICDILKPGGKLVFHEWAEASAIDQTFSHILDSYRVPDSEAPADLLAARHALQIMSRWDAAMNSTDAIVRHLKDAQFSRVEVFCDKPVAARLSVDAFLRYKLAWTERFAELDAMGEENRAACVEELRASLSTEGSSADQVVYDPTLFRVSAWR